MALASQAVEFIAGSAEDILIDLFTGEGDDAEPVGDLAGYTARCQVRYDPDHPDVLAEWSTSGPNLIALEGSTARLKVSAAMAAASLLWTWRLARFDLLLTSPAPAGSVPNRPIRGIIRVVSPITR
jgi:hypothetical protein